MAANWLTKRRRLGAGSPSVAKRSYPTYEVSGSSLECQAAMVQEGPRGATLCLRSGAVAERSYPTYVVSGSSLECQAVMVQKWPRGATLHLRSGVASKRSYPASEVSGSGQEELPHV